MGFEIPANVKKIRLLSILLAAITLTTVFSAHAEMQLRFGIASGTRLQMIQDPQGTFSGQIMQIRPGVFMMRAHRLSEITVPEINHLVNLLQIDPQQTGLYHLVHDNIYMDAVMVIDHRISSPEAARASMMDLSGNSTNNSSPNTNALLIRPVRRYLDGPASTECPALPQQNQSIYEYREGPAPLISAIILQPTTLRTLRERWTIMVEESCGPVDQKKGGGG